MLLRVPPAMATPLHTQHTGQHGDDGLIEPIPWSWPGGSHGATTPLPGLSWGSKPGSRPGCICTGRGAHRDAPWPSTACTKGERPSPRTPVWPYRRIRRATWSNGAPSTLFHPHTHTPRHHTLCTLGTRCTPGLHNNVIQHEMFCHSVGGVAQQG